ncbi:DUF3047 domain-containing protein [Vibrio tapetis subsp. quintayensis]|uniref:DUF3047 domain-containing protein n=1 Tax=Vibrio tapetis TaxID=52443 RepID=UPI0025B5DDED|nr:DUF3047 domain-containing protein [Vibrio tapetis]MDN3679287.1 DUF3047 domain-containing protein [Vibrio tapetis subsp. quintayensis]
MTRYLLLILVLFCQYSSANPTSFESAEIKDWEPQTFSRQTDYELVQLDGKSVLRASSKQSASGLVFKKQFDLLKTPYLSWGWRVSKALPELNERSKNGDDYAARVYVVIEDGFMGLKTKALNYVWSGSQQEGEAWDNAYVGSSVKMVSARGLNSSLDKWYYEKRNIYQDLINYFGDKGSHNANMEAYRYIDAIAIMTDTDNSGLMAEAYYGEIYFSAE